jgi:hypothetical protein
VTKILILPENGSFPRRRLKALLPQNLTPEILEVHQWEYRKGRFGNWKIGNPKSKI